MDAASVIIVLLILLAVFLLLGFPIGFGIILSSCTALLLQNLPFSTATLKLVSGADSFLLTAIPFFILAGVLMRLGGVTQRIINFCLMLFGSIRGALGHVNILSSMIFGGISGSSVADTASIGSILIPEMIRKDYPRDVSAAITATSSTIGIIIPPSLPMILYAMVTEESIGKLFLAGAIPGILVGVFMMVITSIISAKKGYGKEREQRVTLREFFVGLKDGFFAISMPVVIIGGIVLGVVTATEAAVIAVGYAFFLGFFVYRELKISDLKTAALETTQSTAVVMLIVISANLFGYILAYSQIPQKMTAMLLAISSNPITILLLINGILLIVGTFSDLAPNILILTPIFFPVIKELGIDPIHFGIIVIANQAIALVTPPVGNCLYICSNLAKVGIERLLIASLPYLLSNLLVLALVTFFPQMVLFLPKLLMP